MATLENGWVGVDLDGTLAESPAPSIFAVGEPVPRMVALVHRLLTDGVDVRIFTARVAACGKVSGADLVDDGAFAAAQTALVKAWCEEHIGRELPVTATKDFAMAMLFDDRAFHVIANTGVVVGTDPQLGSVLGWLHTILYQSERRDVPPSERLELIRFAAAKALDGASFS